MMHTVVANELQHASQAYHGTLCSAAHTNTGVLASSHAGTEAPNDTAPDSWCGSAHALRICSLKATIHQAHLLLLLLCADTRGV
jgi:hypothetical protein